MLFLSNVFLFAAALKDKGNEAYARGDYATAVQFYTDGLAELRDMKPLYTNRAQVRKIFDVLCNCAALITHSVHVLCCLPMKKPLPPSLIRENSLVKRSLAILSIYMHVLLL